MNREILFRGKRLDNGEWAESLCPLGTMTGGVVHHDFVPVTVGQYTGLTDKNGVKIFEGDIVINTNARRLSNKPQEVKFDALSGYWMCDPEREPVVIGNIHDNPELLSAKVEGKVS